MAKDVLFPRFSLLFLLFLFSSSLFIPACSSRPPEIVPPATQEALRIESRAAAAAARQDYTYALKAYHQAYRLHALSDEQQGQLRVLLASMEVALVNGDEDESLLLAGKLIELAKKLDNSNALYRAKLVKGRINKDDHFLSQALKLANKPLEKAIVLVFLGDIQRAYSLVKGLGDVEPVDYEPLALVLYEYAYATRSIEPLKRALDYYRLSGNYRGISDSLYLLSLIAREEGDPHAARSYLKRALLVNRALDDQARIRMVESALESR